MVWAVSHDTENATYSTALGKLAQRSTTSLINIGIDNGVHQYERVQNHPQCKWSNCGEGVFPPSPFLSLEICLCLLRALYSVIHASK